MIHNGAFGFQYGGGGGIPPSPLAYGSFYDNTDQSFAANTATPMKFNTTDLSFGVTMVNDGLGNPTRITVANTGIYNLQFSAQTHKVAGGGSETMYIWFAKNGLPIADSNTSFVEANNGRFAVLSWNFFLSLVAGQYAQIIVRVTSANFRLEYLTPAGVPAIPSTILTVNQIS